MAHTNSPPDVSLELTHEEAVFLLDSCESNIDFGLRSLNLITSPDLLKKSVDNMEKFKIIMKKLRAQGVST